MPKLGKKEWNIKLIDTRTKRFVNDDTGVFQVFTAGSANHVNIWDASAATATQESTRVAYLSQTMTDGTLSFWTDRTVTTVDVSILTAGGRSYFLDAVQNMVHRVDVDPSSTEFVLTALWSEGGSVTVLKPQGFSLIKGMMLKDVIVNVKVIPTGSQASDRTFNFGRAGDSNGFLAAILLTSTGLKYAVAVSSTGIAATQILGADMVNYLTQGASGGHFSREHYLPSATTALNYSRNGALSASFTVAGTNVGEGYVYYAYTLLPGV